MNTYFLFEVIDHRFGRGTANACDTGSWGRGEAHLTCDQHGGQRVLCRYDGATIRVAGHGHSATHALRLQAVYVGAAESNET